MFATGRGPSTASRLWWLALLGLWGLATAADRLWLRLDQRLPAWDQADYLNSAVDHGRALGLLPGGSWQGWDALLDLSPKIPPLASLVHGTVMAVSGEAPLQASWSLALWHALLLVVVACWARQLQGPAFGLLAAALTAAAPALAELRVDFTLDLALSAATTLALWLLGRWQSPDPVGGHWRQALPAALAVVAAVLIKQSALLVLVPPCLWAAGMGLTRRGRRLQVLAAMALVISCSVPWLRHNWITTIGGTNRAVIESAAREGDPHPLSLASLVWYPVLWPRQLGVITTGVALLGGVIGSWRSRVKLAGWMVHPVRHLPPGWAWLIGCAISGWIFTTLSPNKDTRYIAPVLPLLLILLARGWWQIGLWARQRLDHRGSALLLAGGLIAALGSTAAAQTATIRRDRSSPLPEAMATVRSLSEGVPTTVIVIPDAAEFNEHTATTYGRQGGGQVLGRRVGMREELHGMVLDQAEWILMASGDWGTRESSMLALGQRVRADPRFGKVNSWPGRKGQELELWRRRAGANRGEGFDRTFVRLARGMEKGPSGLAELFDTIGPQHQIDGHVLYQRRVEAWARDRLAIDPQDRDALWSLALLAVLQNTPRDAQHWFGRLQEIDPHNPWPAAYRSVVLIASWNPWQAREVAEAANQRHPNAVLQGLADLAASLGGDLRRWNAARRSIPRAVQDVSRSLEQDRPSSPQRP